MSRCEVQWRMRVCVYAERTWPKPESHPAHQVKPHTGLPMRRVQLGIACACHRRGGRIEPLCDSTPLELRSSPSTSLPRHGTTEEPCASDVAWLGETTEEPRRKDSP